MKKHLLGAILGLGLSSIASAQLISPLANYEISTVDPYTIQRVFTGMRSAKKKTICSNRAMVWTYETKMKHGLDSGKILIHYTDIMNLAIDNEGTAKCNWFCRKTKGYAGWEYHIAPALRSTDGQMMILDKQFLPAPVTAAQWEARFLKDTHNKLNNPSKRYKILKQLRKNISKYHDSDRNRYWADLSRAAIRAIENARQPDGTYKVSCKGITNISEHDNDQYNNFCHIQYTSMYYWNQNDLRSLDKYGTEATDFVEKNVEKSYNAFPRD